MKKRRAIEEQERLRRLGHLHENSGDDAVEQEPEADNEERPKESLLVTTVREKKDVPEATEAEKRLQEEQEVLKQITTKQALKSVKELAKVTISAIGALTLTDSFCISRMSRTRKVWRLDGHRHRSTDTWQSKNNKQFETNSTLFVKERIFLQRSPA